ncbi:MAG TPA: glucose-6-phosphate isomerase, partial [Casimicrobiaceae bacterium]
NALAQSQALMRGRSFDTVRAELVAEGVDAATAAIQGAHRVCPGNRASTTLLMPEQSARRLGQLLALYEHRVFVEGILLGINSFDQWGVELGKQLATPLAAALRGGGNLADADASTQGLLAHVRAALNRRQ